MKEPIARLTRGGETRDAYTAGEATSLRNAGWSPIGEAGPEPVAIPADVTVFSNDESAAAAAAVQPETKRSHHRQKKDQA